MLTATHYDVLGVSRSATNAQIKAAYRAILRRHRRSTIRNPFTRATEQLLSQAKIAFGIISDRQARREYDDRLSQESSATPQTSLDADPDLDPDQPNMEDDATDDAQYRYMTSSMGTEVEVMICGWSLILNISSKFQFQNDITKLSKHAKGVDATSVRFEIAIKRDAQSAEYHSPSINELTVKVQEIPHGLRVVSLKSYFQETSSLSSASSSLTLTIDAEPRTSSSLSRPWTPWEYGFDFDLNERIRSANRATHLIFTVNAPSKHLKGCLEDVLRRNEKLKADAFVDLRANRSLKLIHGGTEMWRLAAVGYKLSPYSYTRLAGFRPFA